MDTQKPRVGVYKFSSCDGCQLAFFERGDDLLVLNELVDIVHFVEAGPIDQHADVDIAFVEGSISTPSDIKRIQRVRKQSKYLVTIGFCATAGGLQALRNNANADQWVADIYAHPEHIDSLKTSTAISEHVKVDLELSGCPINHTQLMRAIRTLLFGAKPYFSHESVCMECKRKGNNCVLVSRGMVCEGPVTKSGCGAICPSIGRGCYGCFGHSENPNFQSLKNHLQKIRQTKNISVESGWIDVES